MTTTLFIQTETTPLRISLPAIAPMTREEFYAFCQANRDLRIERTAAGDVVIMPPAFSDTGNRNFNLKFPQPKNQNCLTVRLSAILTRPTWVQSLKP